MLLQYPDHLLLTESAPAHVLPPLWANTNPRVRTNKGGRSALLHIGCNALRDPRSRRLHRLSRKVGVAGRRLHLPVAEELSDHRQALPQRQCPRSEGVTQVMDPHVLEPRARPNYKPSAVQVAQAPPGPGSGNHPRVVRGCAARPRPCAPD